MKSIFLFGMPGGWEWIVIIFAILLLFGGKKIPELMRGLGQGIREFNRARASVEHEIRQGIREEDKKKLEEEAISPKKEA